MSRYNLLTALLTAMIAAVIVGSSTASAAGNSSKAAVSSISIARSYSQGDYDLDVDTNMHASIFRMSDRTKEWGASISLPYLDITGPASVLFEDIDTGELFIEDIDDDNRSGLGDVVVTVDRSVWKRRRQGRKLTAVLSVKLPTGDEVLGLSSGEADYSLSLKGRVRKKDNLFSGQLGVQIIGDTELTDYDNRIFLTAGAYRFIDRQWGAGASIRHKQASLPERDPQQSASAYITYKPVNAWTINLRGSKGLTAATADYSLGAQITYQWKH